MITVPIDFHTLSQGQVINPVAKLYISFLKDKRNDVEYFTLDQSQLDGNDLLGSSEDNPIQLWDTYNYFDFSDRLIGVSIERSIEFPYNTQAAMCDLTLDNYDNYFTPGKGSTIDQYNLPRRPLKVYAGFKAMSVIPQFVGITQNMPDVNSKSGTVDYHATDFLSEIAEQTLNDTIAMREVRTNEVLAKIVEQFGVLPSQYSFEQGDNIIPFVFFDVGQNAGEAIRQLVQAENGKFWLDEMGILRFQKRYSATQAPALSISDYSIISVEPKGTSDIINHVKISCELREVQEYQTVYSKRSSGDSTSNLWVVGAGQSISRACKLEDPCYDVVNPTLGKSSAVSWFTAKNVGGSEITTGVTATGALSTNAYTITFTNNNLFPVEIDEVELWGEPAKVYDFLDFDAYDDESVEKYGEQVLEITNNPFFQSYAQAESFAMYMLRDRANYNQTLNLEIKGDFALQLSDSIEIAEGDYAGNYVVDSIKWNLGVGRLDTQIKVHKFEPVNFFILDQSQLDGPDVLA